MPGYANGKKPYGVWKVTAVYTNQAWQSSQDPDDDVVLRLLNAVDGVPIEDVTGAERLGIDSQELALVRVIGYPDDARSAGRVHELDEESRPNGKKLEFDCDDYTDGTSGGPFLTHVSADSGQGTVVGVIGGYEQGGDTPDARTPPRGGGGAPAAQRQATERHASSRSDWTDSF